MQYSYC